MRLWTDAQVGIFMATAYEVGCLQTEWRIAEAEAAADATWIPVDRRAWLREREALRGAEEARARASEDERRAAGGLVWAGVENMTAEERRDAYRRLLDSWEVAE